MSRRGFILPLVLWSVAILAMILSVTALAVRGSQGRMIALQARVAEDVEALGVEQEGLFRILTHPYSPDGLDLSGAALAQGFEDFDTPFTSPDPSMIMAVDGTPYLAHLGDPALGLALRLDNDAGRVNLLALEEQEVADLLGGLGIGPNEASTLAAKLADYVDADSVTRFRGAERMSYARAELPAPADALLRTPHQLALVMDWAGSGAYERLAPYLTNSVFSPPFPALMSAEALRDVQGLDEDAIAAIMSARTGAGIAGAGGDRPDPIGFGEGGDIDAAAWPLPAWLISVQAPDGRTVRRLHVFVTSNDPLRPFSIDHAEPRPRWKLWKGVGAQSGLPDEVIDEPRKLPAFQTGAPIAPAAHGPDGPR